MRKNLIMAVIAIIIVLIFAFFYWPKEKSSKVVVNPQEEKQDYDQVQSFLKQENPQSALELIRKYNGELSKKNESGNKWRDVYIQASTQAHNASPLFVLYEYFSESFENQESASLLVGTSLIQQGKPEDYEKLRQVWKDRETLKNEWLMLDVDNLVAQDKNQEAIKLLEENSFPDNKVDAIRLMRLALLNVYDDPRVAWNYFNEAYAKDPTNSNVISYRAKFLEIIGNTPLALSEYIAAVQADPKSKSLRDQLADFYQRHGKYQLALDIWKENLQPPTEDYIWLKALFWGKVVTTFKYNWEDHVVPQGSQEPLVVYLIKLPEDKFWDQSMYDTVPNAKNFSDTAQATFWLRLLQELKEGHEDIALDLLKNNSFVSQSWQPHLERALKRIISYRKSGSFKFEESVVSPETASLTSNENVTVVFDPPMPFFIQLENLAQLQDSSTVEVPQDVEQLLKSSDAFAAAFLSAGWLEAGLRLHQLQVIPEEFPDWYAVEVMKALRTNEGNDEALKFAEAQKKSAVLNLVIGETYILNGETDKGLAVLDEAAVGDSDVGEHAAFLMSLVYLDKNDPEKAYEIIREHPVLFQDVMGQETLAKIALKLGNAKEAERIYLSILDKSVEAKSYIAREAFNKKDFATAKKMTEDLLLEFPANTVLQENYHRILQEESSYTTKQSETTENLQELQSQF